MTEQWWVCVGCGKDKSCKLLIEGQCTLAGSPTECPWDNPEVKWEATIEEVPEIFPGTHEALNKLCKGET